MTGDRLNDLLVFAVALVIAAVVLLGGWAREAVQTSRRATHDQRSDDSDRVTATRRERARDV